MAEDLTVPRPAVAERREDARRRPHIRRFAVAYATLALLTAAAVGGLLWALDVDRKEERAWSSWKPTRDGESRLWEIADHVGAQYVDVQGRPIVQLLAAPPYAQIQTEQGLQRIVVDGVIVKGRATDRSDARNGVFRQGTAFMYILCSPKGRNCALPANENTPRTVLALQREVLELALYAFKYDDDIEDMLLFLPPFRLPIDGQEQQVKLVAYLERDDLKAALASPLDKTLPGSPGAAVTDLRDRAAVISFVSRKLYTFAVEEAPQGLTVLALTPLGAPQ